MALNAYDGVYQLKGYIYRLVNGVVDATLTGNIIPYEMPLATTTNTQVQFVNPQHWANGTGVAVGYPYLDINPVTNAVKISSVVNPPLASPVANDPMYTSHYDPATKTFYISYVWNTGRLCTDTLVYLRPR